jgi:hypothetical protein
LTWSKQGQALDKVTRDLRAIRYQRVSAAKFAAFEPAFWKIHPNRPALNFFNIHATILPGPAKNRKPTVGFSARFFVQASIQRKILTNNGLQTPNTTKT